jgi:carotenoid cleavage dioxygenase-like enzyme
MPEVVRFPDIPIYQGWGAPHRAESEIRDLEVVLGEIPAALTGTLYRCGPDRQYPPRTAQDVFIDGEGMVHMFRIDGGRVDYRNRWVRNERFRLQEAARRSLFGRYRNRYTNDPAVAGKNMGTSNTNVVWHGRRLLVLKEDSRPMAVDPDTLETRGEFDFDGGLKSVSLTAHPKLDLHRNEMVAFSYQAKGDATRDFVIYTSDADGRIVNEIPLQMPYAGMVHDFAVSDSHVVVPFFPLITDLEVIKAGGPYYQWHPDQPSVYAVVPRRGTAAQVRWFRGPAVSAGHMMNAVTEGDVVHLDLCLYEGNCFDFFPSRDGSPFKPAPPLLTRLSFNLATGEYATRRLMAAACEMPKIDDRFMGKPYRYGYVICRPPDAVAGTIGMGAIGRFDHDTGTLATWSPGPDSGVQEPVFVPRGPGAAEGDGYLLVLVNRLSQLRSDLAILDAQKVSDGPVALVRMPTRVRATFHGMWVPQDTLASGRYSV